MDERLEKALAYSNYMVTYNNQRRLIKEKFTENTHYFLNGSHFVVNPELITYVSFLLNKGLTSSILVDYNENPVEIKSLEEFLENISETYFYALNSYLQEINNLNSKRSVEKLIE
jgi:hypothetical protein